MTCYIGSAERCARHLKSTACMHAGEQEAGQLAVVEDGKGWGLEGVAALAGGRSPDVALARRAPRRACRLRAAAGGLVQPVRALVPNRCKTSHRMFEHCAWQHTSC
jgi:hypothetical protein